MNTYQKRAAIRLALHLTLLMSLVLVIYASLAVYSLLSNEKRNLKIIAKAVFQNVNVYSSEQTLPDEIIEKLEQNLEFLHNSGELACAVYRTDQSLLWKSKSFMQPVKNKYFSGDGSNIYLLAVKDKGRGAIDDTLSHWHIMYCLKRDNLVIMVSNYRNFEIFERMVEGSIIALALIILLSAVGTRLYSRHFLKPLTGIIEVMRSINAGNLSKRTSNSDFPKEIRDVSGVINKILDEMESSIHRISDFSSNAAHELRTPLTALRGNIEVCLSRSRTPDQYCETLGATLEEVMKLTDIVNKLLLLSRPGRPEEGELQEVDLNDLIQSTIDTMRDVAELKEIDIQSSLAGKGTVLGNPSLLARVSDNLVQNAVKFAPQKTTISVITGNVKNKFIIKVSNRFTGDRDFDETKVFERFYQADSSRHKGIGLGLSLVEWIADYHNAHIRVDKTQDFATFTFSISLSN